MSSKELIFAGVIDYHERKHSLSLSNMMYTAFCCDSVTINKSNVETGRKNENADVITCQTHDKNNFGVRLHRCGIFYTHAFSEVQYVPGVRNNFGVRLHQCGIFHTHAFSEVQYAFANRKSIMCKSKNPSGNIMDYTAHIHQTISSRCS